MPIYEKENVIDIYTSGYRYLYRYLTYDIYTSGLKEQLETFIE